MVKVLINNEWQEVQVPQFDNGEYERQKEKLINLKLRASVLNKDISTTIKSLAKTTITTPSKKKEYTHTSGYSSQGGCTDGTYIYFYICPQSDTSNGTLVKLKRSDYSKVSTKTLGLYHANDMTYNSKTGLIYVATTYKPTSTSTRIDVINPDTLERVEQKILPFYISAIAYEKTRDIFVGASATTPNISLFKLNEENEFELIKTLQVSATATYSSSNWSSQGIACDSAFIYHSWSYGSWRIEIYDYFGNFYGYMTSDQGKEIEWVDKISKNGFMIGQYSGSGSQDCVIYTFSQK